MQPIPEAHVKRLIKHLAGLENPNPKPSHELDLNQLASLINKVGFVGPVNKRGTVRGFSHELLKDQPMLIDGQFTVHIAGKKVETIRFRDFKQYVLPHISNVLKILEQKKLISKEEENEEL